jgi:Zn-dependent M28 family amino/carboxypeptidase
MKGQVSVEFVAYLSFTLLISAILLSVLYDKQTSFIQSEQEQEAEELASKVSYLAEYALTQDNTSFTAQLPLSIESNSYNVTVESGMTRVEVQGELFRSINNYQGREIDIKSGGNYRIFNNGSVYFEKQ